MAGYLKGSKAWYEHSIKRLCKLHEERNLPGKTPEEIAEIEAEAKQLIKETDAYEAAQETKTNNPIV